MLGSNLDIMNTKWLDVVFKDRNQAYGAYQLRRDNAGNTNRALLIAISIFVSAVSIPTIMNMIHGVVPQKDDPITVTQVTDHPEIEIMHEKVEQAAPQKQVRSQNNVVQDFPPVVTQDNMAKEDPPTQEALKNADPGAITAKGDPTAGVNVGNKVGLNNVEGSDAGGDSIGDGNAILPVAEVNPEYPGGDAAFNKYLSSHIRYPNIAKENGVQGRTFIQFVVERDGSLTDLKALKDPGSGLGEEAIRVLKGMPHWKPGMQNGRPVRVQYTVPVNFSLAE